MRARRDPLRELELIVSRPEWGARNVAEHLASCPGLSSEVGLREDQVAALATMEDQDAAPLVSALLRRRRERSQAVRVAEAHQEVSQAAQRVSSTARWHEGRVELDPGLVLGGLIADPSTKYVSFVFPDAKTVAIPRSTLVAVARNSGAMPGLRVSVDAEALRFSWREGKGGLRFWPQVVGAHERDRVVHVPLAPPPPPVVVPAPVPAPVNTQRRPRRQPQPGLWIRDVLANLGL